MPINISLLRSELFFNIRFPSEVIVAFMQRILSLV